MVWIRTAGALLPVWRHYIFKEWNLRNYNFYLQLRANLDISAQEPSGP